MKETPAKHVSASVHPVNPRQLTVLPAMVPKIISRKSEICHIVKCMTLEVNTS